MDHAAYRTQAERFLTELTDEYRRHYAGLSPAYAIEPVYERHADLFDAGTVLALRDDAAGGPEARGHRMLLDFAIDGFLGQATKALEAELAGREAAITIEAAGRTLGFRESSIAQAAEPDAGARAEIEAARLRALDEQLNPLYEQIQQARGDGARALGYASYAAMCAEVKQIDLEALRDQTRAFLAATEERYPELVEAPLQRALGIEFGRVRRSDLPRFFRAAGLDQHFPAQRLLSSLSATLAGGGIDLSAQAAVRLDVTPRPRKSPRAFCAAVRIPGEVHLVIAPIGGRDDYAGLFHEAGHTEHYAHVSAELPFEFRALGDNAITESYAFLLQHLTEDPQWLAEFAGVPAGGEPARRIAEHGRAERLIYLRRYAGKLSYELELHSGAPQPAERYRRELSAALRLAWPRETFLSDVDPGFYCACYLRAWALETHLRTHLRDAHGPRWFQQRAAWAELRELWSQGQRLTPEELLRSLTGSEQLDFAVMLADLGL